MYDVKYTKNQSWCIENNYLYILYDSCIFIVENNEVEYSIPCDVCYTVMNALGVKVSTCTCMHNNSAHVCPLLRNEDEVKWEEMKALKWI